MALKAAAAASSSKRSLTADDVAKHAERAGTDLNLLLDRGGGMWQMLLEATVDDGEPDGVSGTIRLELPADDEVLVLVPCTAEPNLHSDFHLAAYSDVPLELSRCGVDADAGELAAENRRLRTRLAQMEKKGKHKGSQVCVVS